MPKEWVKLHRKAINSDNLNAALEAYPLAEVLYWRALANCSAYGRLPATAETFKSNVCPWVNISVERIDKALAVLAKYKLIRTYMAGPGKYLEIVNWFRYQTMNWPRTGRPQYPAPPDWKPPPSLLAHIAKYDKDPAHYGLRGSETNNDVDYAAVKRAREGEVRSEKEKEKDKQPTVPSKPKDARHKPRIIKTEEQIAKEEVRLRSNFTKAELDLIDSYLYNCSQANKTGKISAGRIGTELTAILRLKEKYPADAFGYALQQTVHYGKTGVPYMAAIAREYNPDARPPRHQATDQGPTVAQLEAMRVVQATQAAEDNMTDEQRASRDAEIAKVLKQAKQIGKGFEEEL